MIATPDEEHRKRCGLPGCTGVFKPCAEPGCDGFHPNECNGVRGEWQCHRHKRPGTAPRLATDEEIDAAHARGECPTTPAFTCAFCGAELQ